MTAAAGVGGWGGWPKALRAAIQVPWGRVPAGGSQGDSAVPCAQLLVAARAAWHTSWTHHSNLCSVFKWPPLGWASLYPLDSGSI